MLYYVIVCKTTPGFIKIPNILHTSLTAYTIWLSNVIPTLSAMINLISPWKFKQTTGAEKRRGWFKESSSAQNLFYIASRVEEAIALTIENIAAMEKDDGEI